MLEIENEYKGKLRVFLRAIKIGKKRIFVVMDSSKKKR